jgi:release factor glutamine methyltransferase
MFEEGMFPRKALAQCRRLLLQASLSDARELARILLCHVLQSDLHGILMADKPMTGEQSAKLWDLTVRVAGDEPVQYAVGYADFMGLRFCVTPDVLIPRQDTETLLQWAEQRAPMGARVLDVCTGSGCVAIALKRRRPDLSVSACDISEAAMEVAAQNVKALQANVELACGDLFDPFRERQFELIVSNPPYIRQREIDVLQPRVAGFEPRLALDGGVDGLDVLRRLAHFAPACLGTGGALGMEVGWDQAAQVSGLLLQEGFLSIKILEDFEHRPRVVTGEWRKVD